MYTPKKEKELTDNKMMVTFNDFNVGSIEKLEGPSNFISWFSSMKIYLQTKGLWKALRHDDEDEYKKWKALKIIVHSLQPEMQHLIEGINDPQDAWEKLLHTIPTPKTLFKLRQKFFNEHVHEREPIPDYITRILAHAKFLRQNGLNLNDEDIVWTLLSGLPSSYSNLTKTCDVLREVKLTPRMVKRMILNEYERRTPKCYNVGDWVSRTVEPKIYDEFDDRMKCLPFNSDECYGLYPPYKQQNLVYTIHNEHNYQLTLPPPNRAEENYSDEEMMSESDGSKVQVENDSEIYERSFLHLFIVLMLLLSQLVLK